jgi:uncharacterized cupin superfamily protein
MPNMTLQGRLASTVGEPRLLGVIAYTAASVSNLDTGVPFNATGDGLKGKTVLVQPTTACYILTGVSSATAASTTSIKLAADEKVLMHLDTHGVLAAIRVASSGNLLVWELT